MKSSQVSYLKSTSFRVKWNVRAFWKVSEWRNGCVYKTRPVGYVVCSPEYAMDMRVRHAGVQIGPVSTSISKQLL